MDDFLRDLIRLLTLADPNTRVVLAGAFVLGLASGVIGAFGVLRRRALVGDALAHAALPGLCVAYFVVGEKNFAAFLLGALVFGILGVLCISFIRAHTRIKEDAAIGLVLSTFFGLGIVLSSIIQHQPSGNRAGLDTYLFGKAAAMVRQDVFLISIVAIVILAAVVLLFKEFRLLCFDRDFAAAQGWPVFALDVLLMALLCTCTVIGLPAVGVVLVSALLIIPGAAARFWTDRLVTLLIISGAFGCISGLLGIAVSSLMAQTAAGPLVVLFAAACFLVSMLFAPNRGVVADLARRWSLRRRIAEQNVLRAIYEVGEPARQYKSPVSLEQLLRMRAWPAPALLRYLDRAADRGWVQVEGDRYRLTDEGLRQAMRVVRAHRLWETFLIEQADVAPDHVDRDADQIEHVLAAELISQLESRLRREGRLPEPIPASPHPIGETVR